MISSCLQVQNLHQLQEILWELLQNGLLPASFLSFSHSNFNYNFNNANWRKRRWCAWDSNPGCRIVGTDETKVILFLQLKTNLNSYFTNRSFLPESTFNDLSLSLIFGHKFFLIVQLLCSEKCTLVSIRWIIWVELSNQST